MQDITRSAEVYDENSSGTGEIDYIRFLFDILGGIRRFGWLFLAIISILGTIGFYTARYTYSPYYETYSTFTVNIAAGSGANNKLASRISSIFSYILTSDALRNLVIEDMGYGEAGYLPGEISAASLRNSNICTLRVRSSEARLSYEIMRSVLRNYSPITEEVIGDVELEQMDQGGIPSAPANLPQTRQYAAYGMLAGLALCIAFLAVKSLMRKTIRSDEELKNFFNTEYLGNIPPVIFKKRSKKRSNAILIDTEGAPFAFVESMRSIRHRVEREAKNADAKSILVSSAMDSEGKTTAAINLALALARHGSRVLLVDADLRHPSVLSAMGMEPVEKGTADLLAGKCEPKDVIIPYKNSSHLMILPGGKASDEVFDPAVSPWGSARAKSLCKAFREEYDYVVFDTPPSAVLSDASQMARFADAFVFVVRLNYTAMDILREGMQMFNSTGCRLLGCILNDSKDGGGSYGYGYGKYGYGRYGYGRYGRYGRYGHRYGYGRYGSSYGYGYGESEDSGKSESSGVES